MNKVYKIISYVFYGISGAAALLIAAFGFSSTATLSHLGKISAVLIMFVFCALGSHFISFGETKKRKQKILKITTQILLAIYFLTIIDFTLIDDSFGRNLSSVFSLNFSEVKKYAEENTNLIPFSTISLFFNGYRCGKVSLIAFAENIIGNFCAFMPFAYLVPAVFKKIDNALKFLAFSVCFVAVIEILQFVFLTGSADIDDLILNVLGAMTAYGLISKFKKRSLKK